MGHKTIVVIDNDHLGLINDNPDEFVKRLYHAVLTHKRLDGAVHLQGTTVANVVYSCHTSNSPTMKFQDFDATLVD